VGSPEIQDSTVEAADLNELSVGSLELKGETAVVSPAGTGLNNNTPGDATVTRPQGEQLLNGGYAWAQDEANSIIASAPGEVAPNKTWVVRGMPTGGSSTTLFAWASCLAV
jgi:hypothetical protein